MLLYLNFLKLELSNRKHSHDWVCGMMERHCRGGISQSCLSREKRVFFVSVFIKLEIANLGERIESPAGEAKDRFK